MFNKLDSITGKKNEIFQHWLEHPSFDNYWKKFAPYKKEFHKINRKVYLGSRVQYIFFSYGKNI